MSNSTDADFNVVMNSYNVIHNSVTTALSAGGLTADQVQSLMLENNAARDSYNSILDAGLNTLDPNFQPISKQLADATAALDSASKADAKAATTLSSIANAVGILAKVAAMF